MSGERIRISLESQYLELERSAGETLRWPVSTAANGPGERDGSGCTPRGRHRVRARIGAGCPERAVFVGRRFTGEIWTPRLHEQYPGRDWILSRILWLCGCEPGFNRLGAVDSMRRFIYIHGTPDSEPMGEPRSHGCIRMRNAAVMDLFGQVPVGCPVWIGE